MPNGLIVLLVIVGISVAISVLSNWLKSQQQTEQTKAAERRSTARRAPDPGPGPGPKPGKAAGTDIDRFLEEIDKLRKRSAGEPATAKPTTARPVIAKPARPATAAPTIEPKKPKRLVSDPPPVARPAAAVVPAVPVVSSSRAAELPVAPVVTAPARLASLTQAGRPSVTAPPRARPIGPQSEFATQLSVLFQGKQALPLAVVLHEIFGPPRCRRG
jgi:hypothetical protein